MSFCTDLKTYRSSNKLSQRALAKKIGVASSTISRYENGEGLPSKEKEDHIRALLNMPIFKEETKKEEPKPPLELDKFPESKNHEGYSDPTAAKAMKKLGPKAVDPVPCEIWSYRRQSDQRVFNKLILSRNGAMVTAITVFSKPGVGVDPLAIVGFNGDTKYVDFRFIENLSIIGFERRVGMIHKKDLDNVTNRIAYSYLGIKNTEKIVEVEKVVEVEKEIVPNDYELVRQARDIYKYAFDKMCDSLGGNR